MINITGIISGIIFCIACVLFIMWVKNFCDTNDWSKGKKIKNETDKIKKIRNY